MQNNRMVGRCVRLLALIVLSLVAAACGGNHEPSDDSAARVGRATLLASGPRLHGGARSAYELVRAALVSFEARDTAALMNLLVSREEFLGVIYPELGMHYPVANDTRAETQAFLWENQTLGSIKGMMKALRELGGERMELKRITFEEGVKRFRTYTIHEGTRVSVQLVNGEEADMLALGSIVEMGGVYKLLTYRDRD